MRALQKQEYEILHDHLKASLRLNVDDSRKLKTIEILMMDFEKKKYMNQIKRNHGISKR